jgi:hypothetical protein
VGDDKGVGTGSGAPWCNPKYFERCVRVGMLRLGHALRFAQRMLRSA